jgi:hypothetical protein
MDNSFRKQLGSVLLLLLSGLLITCTSSIIDSDEYDIEGVKAETSMVLPLAHGELSIQHFLSDRDSSFLKVASDGLLYLLYEQDLTSQAIGDLFEFQDQTFSLNKSLPAGTTPGPTPEGTLVTINEDLTFNFSPQELSELIFRQGVVEVSATILPSTPANLNYRVLVEFPDLTLNNVPFSKEVRGSASFSLSGYQAKFTDNVTPLTITVIKEAHAGAVTIPPGSSVEITLNFESMRYQYIAGFFGGDRTTSLPEETLQISAFESSLDGTEVSLAEPKASFEVTNGYGIPTQVIFTSLEARKNGAAPLPIGISPASPLTINHPTTPGGSATTTVETTNINSLLDYKPEEFHYKIDVKINPGMTTGTNFCFDNSELKVKFKVEIPLYGKASGIVLSDTFSIDMKDVNESEIDLVALKVNVINELPLDAHAQFYLLNDNDIVIDSLIGSNQTKLIVGSTVNTTGDLSASGVFDDEIEIVKSKIDKLLAAKKLIFKVRLNTTRDANGVQPNVKFKTSYKMKIKLGLKVNGKLNIDL